MRRWQRRLDNKRSERAMHSIDLEQHLAEIIHVMPYWPRERYIDLSPKHWARTRARLAAYELARAYGLVTVPAPLPAEEQASSC